MTGREQESQRDALGRFIACLEKYTEEYWTLIQFLYMSAESSNSLEITQVIRLLQGCVFSYARDKGHLQVTDAQDFCQTFFADKFVRNFTKTRQSFDSARLIKPWLTTIIRCALIDESRRRKRKQEVTSPLRTRGQDDTHTTIVEPADEADELSVNIEQEEAKARIRSIWPDLSDEERTILTRTVVEGKSAEEVAEELSLMVNTVYTKKKRCLDRLRTALDAFRY